MSVEIESAQVYVNQFLQNFAYCDAVFLAERLFAEGKTYFSSVNFCLDRHVFSEN